MLIYMYIDYKLLLYRTLPHTMVTLFQLFTFDAWFNLYNEIAMVSNKVLTGLYILLWIWIGAFVFRNLFVGIMGKLNKRHAVAITCIPASCIGAPKNFCMYAISHLYSACISF